MTQSRTHRLTLMAMLAAMAYVAMLITRPLPKISGFLSYDLKDVVIVTAGFSLGAGPAMLITLVVTLLELVTVSSSGPIGFLMNVLATAAFVLPPSLIYARNKSLRGAAMGLAAGVLSLTAVMLAWNYIITPIYTRMPRESVAAMLVPVILPFNLIKGGLNAGITMLIYKPATDALRRVGLLPPSEGGGGRSFNLPVTLISVFVVVTCVILFYVKAGSPS